MAALPAFCTIPVPRAYAVLTNISGESDTLYVGDSGSSAYEAPLHIILNSGHEATTATVFSSWRIVRNYMDGKIQRQEEYLMRQDAITEYDIEDFGTFTIQYAYSYREAGSTDIIDGELLDPISFSVDASDIDIPNAFSPNGDGINDLFKVHVKSIVSFKMSIFNRWGQLICSGNQDNLQYEDDQNGGYYICWDGTHRGEVVADGVYYIHIEAVGAGGKSYNRRSDINILKGLGRNGQ